MMPFIVIGPTWNALARELTLWANQSWTQAAVVGAVLLVLCVAISKAIVAKDEYDVRKIVREELAKRGL